MAEFIYILGVPNFANYEATAALIRVPRHGGAIDYVCAPEDRLSRVKHTYAFPLRGIHYCLQAFGLESLEEVDWIYTDYARVRRWLNSGPGYRKIEHDYLKAVLRYPTNRIRVVDHHDAHAASTFYPSSFDDAAVLVVDALGSRLNTQTLYRFSGTQAEVIERGDHWGVGRLYALVTGSVLPYGPEKGFGKVMGLAPYGRMHPGPVLEFHPRDHGMTTDYSAFSSRAPLPRIVAGGIQVCEDREAVLQPYFARAAFDVQQECERQMVRMAQYAYERTGARNLCIAGGVGLNGLANARVQRETPFEHVFITPGCSDTGLSLGLALWGYFQEVSKPGDPRARVSMPNAYTGRPYPLESVTTLLREYDIESTPATPEDVGALIANGNVIGWFEGGGEFGPRALGHRSILADPRDPGMKDTLNRRVKFREPYRPYAPSILAEHAGEWLHLDTPSPFMLLVVEVREDKRALVPGVTHVDHTTRPQTVTEEANPNYYRMLREFHRLTGVPMVVNTSLNINREPIVETPIDALICAFGTAIDYMYIEGQLIDCKRYADPQLVKRMIAARAETLDAEWAAITAKYLTRYVPAERDSYLAEGNRIADWHRSYRAKYELELKVDEWTTAQSSIVIVGTRGHTRCLYTLIAQFPALNVAAFVPIDDRPGEAGEFDLYTERAPEEIDWTGIRAVLVSTHEYQDIVASRIRAAAPEKVDVFTMYDDAGDSLLHVLPGKWPVLNAVAEPRGIGAARSRAALDLEAPTRPGAVQRYALIVCYHYCHPPEGFLNGTPSITPEAFDRQLRSLRQNFTCTTIGKLMDPHSDLPEVVAVVTFDDGLKDVAEYALPLLQRWEVPATIYCASAPLAEHRVLSVHRRHLLQARLGTKRFRQEFERALESFGRFEVEPSDRLGLGEVYAYDDEDTRRFKKLLNYEMPYRVLDLILQQLCATFIGADEEIGRQLYLSADDVRRCIDSGLEIGAHGHQHLVHSRLTPEEQRREMTLAADYFASEFGLKDMPWSHPYGIRGCWNDTTNRLLQETGFSSAVTMARTIVKPSDIRARWELPRFDVRDVFDEAGNLVGDKLHALFVED